VAASYSLAVLSSEADARGRGQDVIDTAKLSGSLLVAATWYENLRIFGDAEVTTSPPIQDQKVAI
jgi:hypothetical protein